MTMRARLKYALTAVLVCAAVVGVVVETYVLSPEVRGACVEPLEWAGADDRLAALAADPHREVFEPAMAALVRRGPEAVPALLNRAALPGADGRGMALTALARIGPPARAAAPELKRLMRDDPDPAVRVAAAEALAVVAPDDPDTVAAVARMLDAADVEDRVGAVRVLGSPGLPTERVVRPLTRALNDVNPGVRVDAAETFEKLGPAAKAGIPALALALTDRNPGVRKEAREALEGIVNGLGDADAEFREQGRAALRRTQHTPP